MPWFEAMETKPDLCPPEAQKDRGAPQVVCISDNKKKIVSGFVNNEILVWEAEEQSRTGYELKYRLRLSHPVVVVRVLTEYYDAASVYTNFDIHIDQARGKLLLSDRGKIFGGWTAEGAGLDKSDLAQEEFGLLGNISQRVQLADRPGPGSVPAPSFIRAFTGVKAVYTTPFGYFVTLNRYPYQGFLKLIH